MIDRATIEKIKPGSRVRIYDKYGIFEGIVLARKHGEEAGATFTVRAKLADVGDYQKSGGVGSAASASQTGQTLLSSRPL
jgi:hypothetical protein